MNMNIDWIKISSDDYKSIINYNGIRYLLRIERMDKSIWWYCIYIDDETYVNETTSSLKKAKEIINNKINELISTSH